jgi:membrane-bound ClpP family serine protease
VRNLAIIIASLILGTVLMSGLAEIHLVHKPLLPDIITQNEVISVTDKSNALGLLGGKQIDIRLPSEIKGLDTVRPILRKLQEASRLDTVIFHLAGYGGEVDTVMTLINNIKSSKAEVIMVVEAPVYSGHAYLAISGSKLVMLPYSSLMFHTTSALGMDCSKAQGTDRTVSNVEHCEMFFGNHFYLVNRMILDFLLLTPEEKVRIISGHDVYITADEYNKRLNAQV